MATAWYIQKNNKSVGPLSAQQLRELALAGKLQSGDLVRKGEVGEFKSASRIKNLFAPDQAASRPTPPPPRFPLSTGSDTASHRPPDLSRGRSGPYQIALSRRTKAIAIAASVAVCLALCTFFFAERPQETAIDDLHHSDTRSIPFTDNTREQRPILQLTQEREIKPGQGIDYITTLTMSESGQFLVVNHRLYDVKSQHFVRFGDVSFDKVALSPNRRLLGTAPSEKLGSDRSFQPEVRVYSLADDTPKQVDAFAYNGGPFSGVEGGIKQVWWSPASDMLLVNESDDRGVFLCPIGKAPRRISVPYPSDDKAKEWMSRQGGYVDTDNRVIASPGIAFRTLGSVSISPTGTFSLSRPADGTHVLALSDGQHIRHFGISEPKSCSFACFSPDGTCLAVATEASVELLNADTFTRIAFFGDNHHKGDKSEWIEFAVFSPDSKYLLVQSRSDSFVTVIPCDPSTPSWTLDGPVLVDTYAYGSYHSRAAIAFSPDCSNVLFVAKDMLSAWNLKTKQRILAFRSGDMTCADWFSEDRLLIGHGSGMIREYSIAEVMGTIDLPLSDPQSATTLEKSKKASNSGQIYFVLTEEEQRQGWSTPEQSSGGYSPAAPPITVEKFNGLRIGDEKRGKFGMNKWELAE